MRCTARPSFASGSGTVNALTGVNTTSGNLVILAVEADAASLVGFSATIGAVNFAQLGATLTINDGSSRSLGLFSAISPGGTATAACSFTGTQMRCQLSEFNSGSASPLVFDQFNSATGSGTALNSGNITPSVAAELVFGYGWDVNGGLAVGTNFTLTHAVGSFQVTEYQIINSTTSLPATATGTSATAWGMLVASFRTQFNVSGNAGEPLATVTYSGTASGSVTADGSGNFTIPALSNGSYTLTPTLAGFAFSPTSSPETVNNADITGVNFTGSASGGGNSSWLGVGLNTGLRGVRH